MIPGFANLNYYEILDVSMGVDAKEVQEAYYLIREAFSKNSLSSYSLYSQEEREEISRLIEEAYHILFDDQSRHEYDRNLSDNRIRVEKSRKVLQTGLPFAESELQKALAVEAAAAAEAAGAEPEPAEPPPEAPEVDESQRNLPFVDATPPPTMALAIPEPAAPYPTPPPAVVDDRMGESSEPVWLTEEAEAADPAGSEAAATEAPASDPAAEAAVETTAPIPAVAEPTPPPAPAPAVAADPTPPPAAVITQPITVGGAAGTQSIDPEISTGPRRAILDHLRDGITGLGLKRVREQQGFSLDQAFEVTRIRRPILQSIEEEEFDQLPAAVFLRGMVANYARFLGLPDPETTAKSYVERMTAALGG